ncbi:MAG: phosphoribosylglycinamide formyltransferase [Lachnospiraceae bacterium]|nr:phosphoribosylglycinamide formyltransferase [Lachnospiraceae bacterium]
MKKIAVFVSGGGTNLQAILDAQSEGKIKSGEVCLVISNRSKAYAIERAKNAGVPVKVIRKMDCAGQEEFEEKIAEELDKNGIDLIVLAGWLAIFSPAFTKKYDHRIINVHPSLIPSFCGEGFYGLKVHEEALKKGVKVTGATVHYVNEIPDGGEIIAQKAVRVLPGDTPERLQKRVMRQAEWKLLPAAIEEICGKM